MKEHQFSQEFLNAFVDDQLTAEEKSHAYPLISQDEALNRAVCELRKTRDLVRHAYKDVPMAPSRDTRPARAPDYLRLSAAAGIALAVGISLGWVLHEPPPAGGQPTAGAPRNAAAETMARDASLFAGGALPPGAGQFTHPAVPANVGKAAVADTARVLIHVNYADKTRLGQMLDEIEQLVQYYRANHQTARVEVILNGEGLTLVRADVSPYAARVERLQQDYDNLAFVACQNTIERLKREQGITARLLPGVSVIDSGVAQLMRRQHQGWAYIQV